MFDWDKWQEIFETIQKNPLRTILTGFSVTWGIFMLCILLAAGNGLSNGVQSNFGDNSFNSLWISSDVTSIPYEGMNVGRRITLKDDDVDFVTHEYSDNISAYSGRYFQWGTQVNYKTQYGTHVMMGVHPGYQVLEGTHMLRGRYINQLDIDEKRKVVIMGKKLLPQFFGEEDPLGKQIELNGVSFQIVGIFTDPSNEREEENFFVPITTAQQVYNGGTRVGHIIVNLSDSSLESSQKVAASLRADLGNKHGIHPEDQRAIHIRNLQEQFQNIFNTIVGIKAFVWLIGIMTIIAGIVGVSNIMLVVVKERTKEIGIRKAIGATPFSIIAMIIQESVFITAAAGYLGLLLAVLLVESFGSALESDFLKNPNIDFDTAIVTTVILVITGAFAGLVPARRAAKVQPIEALKDV